MSLKNVKVVTDNVYSKKFLSSLSNFCTKCPLQPKITYIPSIEKVIVKTSNNEIEVILDPSKDKKVAISEIKEILIQDYPIIYNVEKVNLSTREIDELIIEGKPLDDALLSKKDVIEKYGRLERIHNKFNELDIYNFNTNKIEKYKGKIPLVFLIDKIEKNEWEDFWNSVYFVSTISNQGGWNELVWKCKKSKNLS